MILNRATCTMMTPAEHAEWTSRMEDQAFLRKPRQGELTSPMVIGDSLGVQGLKSQVDGRMYDSKSNLRRHYREKGVIEVGNDGSKQRGKPVRDPKGREKRMDAIGKAMNRVGLPTC